MGQSRGKTNYVLYEFIMGDLIIYRTLLIFPYLKKKKNQNNPPPQNIQTIYKHNIIKVLK